MEAANGAASTGAPQCGQRKTLGVPVGCEYPMARLCLAAALHATSKARTDQCTHPVSVRLARLPCFCHVGDSSMTARCIAWVWQRADAESFGDIVRATAEQRVYEGITIQGFGC